MMTHRGTKEMDLLLGNFVKKNINILTDNELIDLKKLTYIEDNILMKWYFENSNKDQVPVNKVTKMFKKFKL